MRFSLFGIAAFAFITTTQVIANPVANTNPVELVEKRDFVDVDVIITTLIGNIKTTDSSYKSTCAGSCSSSHIVRLLQSQVCCVIRLLSSAESVVQRDCWALPNRYRPVQGDPQWPPVPR
jgi:hypothetical protein